MIIRRRSGQHGYVESEPNRVIRGKDRAQLRGANHCPESTGSAQLFEGPEVKEESRSACPPPAPSSPPRRLHAASSCGDLDSGSLFACPSAKAARTQNVNRRQGWAGERWVVTPTPAIYHTCRLCGYAR